MNERKDGLGDQEPEAVKDTAAKAVVPTTLTAWSDTYGAAQQWIQWNGRKRWPQHPVNDDVWAMSVTAWQLNGRAA